MHKLFNYFFYFHNLVTIAVVFIVFLFFSFNADMKNNKISLLHVYSLGLFCPLSQHSQSKHAYNLRNM